MKTFQAKPAEVKREWYVVDAEGKTLGRLATQIARILTGKHKRIYTPGVDTGDFVIVVNAAKFAVTGNKMDEKFYTRHSQYPGGFRKVYLREQLVVHPEIVIQRAVWGMLPHNRLGRQQLKKLKIYTQATHPHAAQQPKILEVKA
ncbi:MAG: 50S ribosomal protein L13 [Anaerolineae bacterium]|nr:50S ribosomal protein L13 [Anaerolineae bacterium]MDL1895820.1 50S ribosomal protein L13 [Anaerolineae bacterium CFX7]RIK34555.1 MAG: 50S ribosomal protein L13 [Chloroflexota bacterium]